MDFCGKLRSNSNLALILIFYDFCGCKGIVLHTNLLPATVLSQKSC